MLFDLKNKDKRTGWIISISIHAAVVVLFFFILAWQAPDPPLPEYGIELNFGLEEAGSGFEQPTVTPTPPTIEDEGEPEEQIEEEVEEVVEEQPEPEPVEESAVEELPDSQQEDSPVETQPTEVKEVPVEPVEEKVEEDTKPVSEPVVEPPKEEPKVEEKKVDANALYPGSSSQGKKDDSVGDEGDPEGSPDSRNLMGKQGGGSGGPDLRVAGWRLDSVIKKDNSSSDKGEIIFEIMVDKDGYVTNVKPIKWTVSQPVLNHYRDEVYNLTLQSTTGIPKAAKGTITITIKSK